MENRLHRGVLVLCLLPLAAIAIRLGWDAVDHGIVEPIENRALVKRLPELEAAVEARLAAAGWSPPPDLYDLRMKAGHGTLDDAEIASLRAILDRPSDPAAVDRRVFLQIAAIRLDAARRKGDASAARSLESLLSEIDSKEAYASFLSDTARWRSSWLAADRNERACAASILDAIR